LVGQLVGQQKMKHGQNKKWKKKHNFRSKLKSDLDILKKCPKMEIPNIDL